ncbi:MAG: RHS repeat-associated core domain-containing protein [Prevotella sp.]|nr:RHS repeat-associated core domain-containing protein [Staphylococcus sp.]MCM1351025.1 RHS repeat-associated core domain-containing protein [Prevotella sp.]
MRKKRLGIFSKIVILLLVLGFIFPPYVGFSVAASINMTKDPTYIKQANETTNVEKVELPYLRKRNLKVYLQPDNTLEYVYYNKDVHYFNGNEYVEFENEIIENPQQYMSINQNSEVYYPKKWNNTSKIEISYQGYQLGWSFDQIKATQAIREGNTIQYSDVFSNYENVDLSYYHSGSVFKENIILHHYQNNFHFGFYLYAVGLNMVKKGTNQFSFINDEGIVIYEIDPFFMYDTHYQVSYDITVEVKQVSEFTYFFQVTPNDEWLKTVTYPVVIDPIVETICDDYALTYRAKTYFKQYPTSDPYSNDIFVGCPDWEPGGVISIVELLKPTASVDFSNANIVFMNNHFSGIGSYSIYKFNTAASFDNITGVNYTAFTKTYIKQEFYSSKEVSIPYSQVFTNDATKALLYFNPSGTGFVSLSQYSNDAVPVIRITNVVNKDVGVSFDDIHLGRAGDAKINLATGELTYGFNDSHFMNDNLTWDISHHFRSINTSNVDSTIPYGRGFHISYHETLELVDNHYIYTRGDGSQITFVKPTTTHPQYVDAYTYISTNLNGYKLVVNPNGMYHYILYAEDIRIFESIFNQQQVLYLTKILESLYIDNAININYTTTNGVVCINKVVDNAYNQANFIYDELTGLLNKIEFNMRDYDTPQQLKPNPTTLSYSLNYIYDSQQNLIEVKVRYQGSVDYEKDASIHINYNEHNLISTIYYGKPNAYELGKQFIYPENANSFLKQMQVVAYQSYMPGVTDFTDQKSYIYQTNKTMTKDATGCIQRYWFDTYGNIIKMEDSNLNTIYYCFENTPMNQHNLVDIKVGNTHYINYLQDPTFQTNDIWYATTNQNGWISKFKSSSILLGNKIGINRTSLSKELAYHQKVVLPKGKYYLSSLIQCNGTKQGAYLTVEVANDNNGSKLNVISTQSPIIKSSTYQHYALEFEIIEETEVIISLHNDDLGYAYFEYVNLNQTSKNVGYNLIENGSFEQLSSNDTIDKWAHVYWSTSSPFLLEPSYQSIFGNTCGVVTLAENASQTIAMAGTEGDKYIFQAWYAPTYYQEMLKNGYVQFRIFFQEANGSSTCFSIDSKTVEALQENKFNFDSACLDIVVPHNYTSITIEANVFGHEAFLIDNLSLVKQEQLEETSDDVDTTEITSGLPQIDELTLENRYLVYDALTTYTLLCVEDRQKVTDIEALMELVDQADELEDGLRDYKPKHKAYENAGQYGYDYQYIIEELNPIYGNTTYLYDTVSGQLTSSTTNGVTTSYQYDIFERLISVMKEMQGTNTNLATIHCAYDTLDRITDIFTPTATFSLEYTDFGHISSISINGDVMVSYQYLYQLGIETDYITKYTYVNGYTITYTYDDFNHPITIQYHDGSQLISQFTLKYDLSGNLLQVKHSPSYYEYNYEYDTMNRLVKMVTNQGVQIYFEYNQDNEKQSTLVEWNGQVYHKFLTKDDSGYTTEHFNDFNYSNQTSGESQDTTIETIIQENILFTQIANLNANGQIASITYKNERIDYTYENGLITMMRKETYDGDSIANIVMDIFEYNGLDELIHHRVYFLLSMDEIITDENIILDCYYTYDGSGNITSIRRPICYLWYEGLEPYVSYTYHSIYKDQLIAKTIKASENGTVLNQFQYVYDALGNLIQVYQNQTLIKSYTYMARNLVEQYDYIDNLYIEYKYNENGIRYAKYIYDYLTLERKERHDYIILDNRIQGERIYYFEEDDMTSYYQLYYYYNESSQLIGLSEYNSLSDVYCNYFYQTTFMGDIIGIYNANYEKVATYTYDAYGNIAAIEGTDVIKDINPFRYRGYYYDQEVNMYYCNSRYYDASIGRWQCTDDLEYLGISGTTLSYNLYSYCENNPIIYSDYLGTNIIKSLFSKIINLKNGVLSIARGIFSGIIDVSIAIIATIFPVLGTASTLLIGVKNIGRFLSKKAFEKLAKKVFTKTIINFIVKAIVFLLTSILSLTINICVGTIANLVYGCVWMLTSIGNFIGGILDFCDGIYDGYFRIKIS